jgi:hypothetical protein
VFSVAFVQGEIRFDHSQNLRKADSFWYAKQVTSDTEILGFDELQGVYFDNDSLIVQQINQWDSVTNLQKLHLKNVRVSSHMLYFQKNPKTKGRLAISAEIEFADSIIGFLADNVLFEITNPLFAPDPTHKKTSGVNGWSLEQQGSWTELDTVTMLSPRRIRVSWTNQSATDALRVFTLDKKATPLRRASAPLPKVLSPTCTRVLMSPLPAGMVYNLRGQRLNRAATTQVILNQPQFKGPAEH